jgi:hypothetical protein
MRPVSEQGPGPGVEAASGGVTMSFEQWAELSARLLKRKAGEREKILERHSIEPEDWTRIDDHFKRALGDDISEGDGELGVRYGAVCVAELARRRAEASAPAAPPVEEPPAAAEPAPEVAVAPVPATPSYLRGPAEYAAPVISSLPASPTGPGNPLASTLAALPRPPDGGPALPFDAAPSADFVASLSAPAPAASPRVGGETLPVAADLARAATATLPFGKSVAASLKPATMRLTIEDYAAVCVELALYPDRALDVMRRYHVPDEQTLRAIDADWKSRLSAHPDTHQRWQELYLAHRNRLLGGR